MTQTGALRLALDALKMIDEAMPFPVAKLAQAAIKEALAQPEQEQFSLKHRIAELEGAVIGLQAQRTWVGLTNEEIKKIVGLDRYTDLLKEVVQIVEAKLRSKNNG